MITMAMPAHHHWRNSSFQKIKNLREDIKSLSTAEKLLIGYPGLI
jgi:hypothetical protein